MTYRDEHEALRVRLAEAEKELQELRPLRLRNRKLKRELKKLRQLISNTNADNVAAMRKAHDEIALWESRARDAYAGDALGFKRFVLWIVLCVGFVVIYQLVAGSK